MCDLKIIARLFGGLGNMLFIYAAARRLALVNDTKAVLDDVTGFTHDDDYQRQYQLDHFSIPCRKATAAQRLEPFGRLRRKVLRSWNQRKPFEERAYFLQESVDLDPHLLQFKPRGTVYLEGYLQSKKYFKVVEGTIRQDLGIKPPTDFANLDMADQLRSGSAVALHVRFFDESYAEGINNASGDYYIGTEATA